MSISIMSPSLMKRGTRISAPVSTVAGLVRGGVALEARLGVGHLEHNLHGDFDGEDGVGGSVDGSHHVFAFLQEVNAVDDVGGDVHLLKSFVVHEHEVFAFPVEVLELAVVHLHVLQFGADDPGALEHTSVLHVAQFGAHHGVALSGFHMKEVDDYIDSAVDTKAHVFLDVSC